MAKKTISITEGRKQLFRIAEEVQRPDTYYTFTVDGKPQVVLMSQDEFNSIMDTMEILSDPKLLKDIEKAEEEFERGEYESWDDVKKELGLGEYRGRGLLLREKPKRGYKAKKRIKKHE